jgi:hypothetical protein
MSMLQQQQQKKDRRMSFKDFREKNSNKKGWGRSQMAFSIQDLPLLS